MPTEETESSTTSVDTDASDLCSRASRLQRPSGQPACSIHLVGFMSNSPRDLPHDTRLPELLRQFLAVTGPTQQPDAPLDVGGAGLARPLPGNPEVLKVLIEEARAFLGALEPVRKNFRVLVRLLGRLKGVDAVPEREAALLQELAANNREKVLNLGPAIYGLMPFVQWDPESARAFLATFGRQDNAPAGAPDDRPETRLRDKFAAVECFAERIQDLYQRLLDRLEGSSGPAVPVVAKYPEEDRDRWIYERLCAGLAFKEVLSQLQGEVSKQRWAGLDSAQALRYAAKKYASMKHLPEIPPRKAPRK